MANDPIPKSGAPVSVGAATQAVPGSLLNDYNAVIKAFPATSHAHDENFESNLLALETLNDSLCKTELESLHSELVAYPGNANVDHVEGLVRRLRTSLRDMDESRQRMRAIKSQDPIRRLIKKLGLTDVGSGLGGVLSRYLIANIGGASLLIPMIIMSFATSRASHLIVTSIFVLGFAFMVAIGTEATNQELLGATAAYAAVLVVYVGTASST